MVSVITTAIAPDTPLNKMVENGEFIQLTEKEIIEEELLLLEKLDMDDNCYFFGSHLNNLIGVSDYFKYKDRIIKIINDKLINFEETRHDILYSKMSRDSV